MFPSVCGFKNNALFAGKIFNMNETKQVFVNNLQRNSIIFKEPIIKSIFSVSYPGIDEMSLICQSRRDENHTALSKSKHFKKIDLINPINLTLQICSFREV